MSAIYDQVIIAYLDANGEEACSFLTTQDQTGGGTSAYVALAGALQACSDAAVYAIQRQTTLILTGSTGAGPYNTIFDRGVLFSTIATSGQQARVPIIAPKSSLFLPDTVKIDLANPLITALQTQCVALIGDRNGHAILPFKRGRRQEAGNVG